MKKLLTLTTALFLAAHVLSQTYQQISTSLPDAGRSQVAWGDYDNDGDLDLFLSGLGNGEVRISSIFRNDEGEFTDIQAGLPGMKETAAMWGDYDNDGDLDLVMGGNTENGDQTFIVENEGWIFTALDIGLPGISNGDVSFGDFDNDGDLDLFLTGNWEAGLYRNDEGSFIDTEQDFGYWSSSSMSWGDHDNDGDLDILIIGDSGAGARSKVFTNVSGIFSEADVQLPGLMAGTTDWVDYDNDGDLDIAITGYNDALEAQFLVFNNEGEGQFAQAFLGIEGVALSSVDWGDVDGDGDLDLITTGNGSGCGVIISGIYLNDFPFFNKIATSFTTALRASLQWADYDNDGDLDFVISGLDYADNPFTELYRNVDNLNLYVQNTSPSIPGNLSSIVEGGNVRLQWERSADPQTPQGAISYNIRLGTTPGGDEIASGMADVGTGNRYIMELGNVNLDTSWTICMLNGGTYYWSVQAIDQAFSGSGFAAEESFTVIPTGVDETSVKSGNFKIFPNPATDHVHILSSDGSEMKVTVTDQQGRVMITLAGSAALSADLSTFPKGVYYFRIESADETSVKKVIRR